MDIVIRGYHGIEGFRVEPETILFIQYTGIGIWWLYKPLEFLFENKLFINEVYGRLR